MNLPIPNRRAAGRTLATFLESYRHHGGVLVLALSPDAVPVAYEIASGIDAGLDLFLVRELPVFERAGGSPGAVVSDFEPVFNEGVLQEYPVGKSRLGEAARREQRALSLREQTLRGARPRPELKGRCVILVEDCLANGALIRAAVRVLRDHDVARLVVAVPVASTRVMDEVQAISDEIAYIATQEPFLGLDWWYEDAQPVPDEEVRALLERIPPGQWSGTEGATDTGRPLSVSSHARREPEVWT